uniref:Fucosyltransferase n=1 Tax=Meloidogyne floridensis TaxID=298350 RepID=A0A915NXX4_9BILA
MMRYRNFFTSFRELSSQPVRLKQPISKPLILMWTNIFRLQTMQLESDCPLASLCELTYNRVPTVPDLPYQSANEQRVNVFLSHENPTILRTMYMSGALSRHVHNFFHWAMTYVNTSHVSMPYGGFWLPPAETTRLGFKPIQLPSDQNTILHNKTQRGILWLVSNCNSNSKREVAVEALSKYINIKIGGKCGKTPEDRNLCPRNRDCSYLYSNYYFYIAMENDICNNYVTEKFWERYTLPSVPIVLKASIYQGFIPDNSFIALDQFKTPKQMAEHLNWLMDNPIQYLKYFEWRSKGWSIAWNHEGFRLEKIKMGIAGVNTFRGAKGYFGPGYIEQFKKFWERFAYTYGWSGRQYVTEAIRRYRLADPYGYDLRQQRILRASFLVMNHERLPKNEWTTYDGDSCYLASILDDIEKEKLERVRTTGIKPGYQLKLQL